jgi:hypothetical protein
MAEDLMATSLLPELDRAHSAPGREHARLFGQSEATADATPAAPEILGNDDDRHVSEVDQPAVV